MICDCYSEFLRKKDISQEKKLRYVIGNNERNGRLIILLSENV